MTNKKFRDDLAKEMRDKYNERNEKLEQAEKSSFSDGLKEQMKKEIMDNFDQEMEEMKSRPGYAEARKTYVEEIKAKIKLAKSKKEKERLQKEYEEKLAKADEDISESRKVYEDAQIAHRGEVEQTISENSDIPAELVAYREARQENIRGISEEAKEKIKKAAEKIQPKVTPEGDGSRLIEFNLGGKLWTILDPNLATHTDSEYKETYSYGITGKEKTEVKLGGMRGDDVTKWKNKKLSEYVQQKQSEGLHVAKVEELKKLVDGLGNEAGLSSESDKVAMLMYLTGMEGRYWGTMGDHKNSNSQANSRSSLNCSDYNRWFYCNHNDNNNASLCMIACK